MTVRIDNSFTGQLPTGLGQGGQTSLQSSGMLRGEEVKVKDAASVLTDAAEEMSVFMAEAKKTHAERSVRGGGKASTLQAQKIAEYLDKAKSDADKDKLGDLARRMLSQGGQSAAQLARQFAPRDPTRQFIALQHALQQGQAEGAPAEVLDHLRDALADLEADHGPTIRSDLNTVDAAARYGSNAQQVRTLQQAYSSLAQGHPSVAQMLQAVLQHLAGRSGKKLALGLQSLIEAAGQDAASAHPSVDKERLEALITDLYQLSVINTVLEGCTGLMSALQPGESEMK